MRFLHLLFPIAVSVLAPVAVTAADQVPHLDVDKSCRAAQDYGLTADREQTFKSCLQDEKDAKAQLSKKWSQFKLAQRRNCVPPAPSPSYVEMLTCLEMNQDSLLPYSSSGGGATAPATGTFPHGSPSPRPAPSPGPRGFRSL